MTTMPLVLDYACHDGWHHDGVSTLTDILKVLGPATLGGGLTLAGVWMKGKWDLRQVRFQRSKDKAEEVLRAVDVLELAGPVPGLFAGGEGPHAGSGMLPDPQAARAAVVAVKNSALLIGHRKQDRKVRERLESALKYLKYCTYPGMFKTLPVESVWSNACGDIRRCTAAYVRGDKLPDPPRIYEHYDRLLAPLQETLDELRETVRRYVESSETEGA